MPERRGFLNGLLGSLGLGNKGMVLVYLTPVGMLFAGQEMQRAKDAGDFGGAAIGAMAMIPASRTPIQAAKTAAKEAYHGLNISRSIPEISRASKSPNVYNSPIKNQRVFEADYPHGAQADETGKLLKTIDGDDITARLVVGRKVAGGADEAITPAAFDAIAEAVTGRATKVVSPGREGLGRNDVGSVPVVQSSRRPLGVLLSNKLTPDQLPGVYGHEIGHVIDQAAREILLTGVQRQAAQIYNTLNTGAERTRNLMGPQHVGYDSADIPRELMAEGIRSYMAELKHKSLNSRNITGIQEPKCV